MLNIEVFLTFFVLVSGGQSHGWFEMTSWLSERRQKPKQPTTIRIFLPWRQKEYAAISQRIDVQNPLRCIYEIQVMEHNPIFCSFCREDFFSGKRHVTSNLSDCPRTRPRIFLRCIFARGGIFFAHFPLFFLCFEMPTVCWNINRV